MIRLPKMLMIIWLAVLVSGCAANRSNYHIVFSKPADSRSETQEGAPSPVRVAISSVLSPSDTIKYYRTIADYIGEKLNRPAILIQRKSYHEISTLLMNGGADIALLSSGAYLTYKQVEGLEAIAMQERMGVPYYYGYLIVNRDSNIAGIGDLREKSIAITDPASYSSYIFLSKRLAEFGETPEHFFDRYVYTYSHEKSLKAVIDRVVDAAAVNSLVYEQAKRKNPELTESLRIIAKSDPAGTGPVIISNSLPDKDKKLVKELFLSMDEQQVLKPALQGLFIDRFVPFDPQFYDTAYSENSYTRGRP